MPYKFLRTDMKSDSGSLQWRIGEWQHVEGELSMCENGLHCSPGPYDAFTYVQGEILAEIETGEGSLIDANKSCHRSMRVIRAWHWRKEDSVALAAFAARQVLYLFEYAYPTDDRPRKAIEAAETWIDNPDNTAVAAAAYVAAHAAASAHATAAAHAASASAAAAAYAASASAAAYAAYASAAAYASSAAYAASASAAATASASATATATAASAAAAHFSAAHAASAYNEVKEKLNDWMADRINQLNPVEKGY